jgi:prepilin peptidase CpaA
MKIPNWISLALIGDLLSGGLLVGLSPVEVAIHVGVGFAALIVGMIMFALRWIGGGDAKLLAASCLWMGLERVSRPCCYGPAIAGGVSACC